MKATHSNGYTAELRDDGALFIIDNEGNEVLCSRQCAASSEESLLKILESIPSFLAGIRAREENKSEI